MHTTILKGVRIGNNVIIGANSLINKNIPDNCVVAGNPCKILMTLEQYYEKRKKVQVEEATELVQLYRQRFKKDPDYKALHEFFWLFENDPEMIPEVWKSMNKLCGNEEFTKNVMRKHQKKYENMHDFLESISECN